MKPKLHLSPDNIASIRYGKWLGRVLAASRRIRAMRKGEIVAYNIEGEKASFAQLLEKARAARARIFRDCCDCVHEDAFECTVRGERLIDCRGWIEYAPTCPHYKERGEP